MATFKATGGRYTDFGDADNFDEEGTVVDGGNRTYTMWQRYRYGPGANPDLTEAEVQVARYIAPVSTGFQTPTLEMMQTFYATVDLTSLCTVTPG